MKAIICDICGKTINSESIGMIPRYQIKKRLIPFNVKSIELDCVGCKHSIDVCKNCWNDFKKFVELKKRT